MSDVVIVGGGPVGLFLAALLVQQGLHVTVLERRLPDDGGHSRAIGIHPPALAALARAGVDQDLIRGGVPIRRGVALAGGRALARMSFDGVSAAYPFVLSLPQDRTEALLESRLFELDPGALRRGVTVSGLDDDGRRVRVRAVQDGRDVAFSAPLVIGADGVRSTVRAALGIPLRTRNYRDRYTMGDFADGTDFAADAALFLAAEGIVESFPLPGRLRRWVVRLNVGGAGPAGPGSCADAGSYTGAGSCVGAGSRVDSEAAAVWLAAEVQRRTGVEVDAGSNGMLSAFGVRSRLARRMVAGPCVLIGDAAHEISPIGGQGMNLGWLDAVELAPLVPALIAGHDGGVQGFERLRMRAAVRAARQAEINMALGRPLRGGALAARNRAVAAAAGVPVLNRLAARRFTMQ